MAGQLRITIAAVGRAKAGPARDLYEAYVARLSWSVHLKEVEERRPLAPAAKKASEAALLRKAAPQGACRVALDEHGKNLSSKAFARQLASWRDTGLSDIVFFIGGADGLDDSLRQTCRLQIAFGAATWPHMLVRGLLAEQLYRAQSILSGHPYHRE